ncbi:MAG: glycosyltransferase family 2 protein [Nitrospinales bacterium]
MKMISDTPDLSIIVIAMNNCNSVHNLIEHLSDQTVADKIELTILTAHESELFFEGEKMELFFAIRISHVDSGLSLGEAKAAGLRLANSPVVVFLEDHVFPEAGFAEAIVKAHGKGWAAVGPVMRNANPVSKVSWAQFLIFFYPWVEPAYRQDMDQLTWNSSSYKKELLLEFGSELPNLLRAESILQAQLRMKGHRIILEPDAVCYHYNFCRLKPWLLEIFNVGRVFAFHRSRNWSILRRLNYCLGAPLIPLIKLGRILPCVRKVSLGEERLLKILPFMMVGLLVNAAGEMLSYASGSAFEDYYFRLSKYHEANLAYTEPKVTCQ